MSSIRVFPSWSARIRGPGRRTRVAPSRRTRRGHRSPLPLLLALPVVAFGSPATAQEKSPFTVEDALNVRSVSIADVSPDGRWIAVTTRTHRDRLGVDHGRFGDPTYVAPSTERVLVLDAETGEETPLFGGRVQTRALTWSPDGERLALFLRQGDAYGLRVYHRLEGRMEVVELADPRRIASDSPLEWRPDGEGLLLTLRPEGWAERAREMYERMTEGPVVVQDSREPFLAWQRVRDYGDIAAPVVVDLESRRVHDLLPPGAFAGFEQSEDGRWVSVVGADPVETAYDYGEGTEYRVLRVDVESGDTLRLLEPTMERLRIQWSPDGRAFAWADEGDVMLRALEGDSAVNLTAGKRGAVSDDDTTTVRYGVMRWSPGGDAVLVSSQRGWHLLDVESGEVELAFEFEEDEESAPRRGVEGWSPDGRWLYVATSERDRWERGLARLDVEDVRESDGAGEARVGADAMEQLVADENLYRSWRLSEDGSRLVFTMSDGDHPQEVHVADPAFRSTRRLTDLNPWLADRALTRSELVEYLDADGNTLYGVLYYPVDYEEGKRYPLVSEVYEDFFDNGFNHRMNLVANQGWFGFRPSVEFETGYPGEAWLKGVTAGINELMDRGLVDGEKLGVHGTSYGGYAVNLLITQTDRFAAAINISGKVNIISFLGDSPKITVRNYAAAEVGQDRIGATLWEQPQKYIAHSAVMFADRIDTPLLMLSGEGDWNVPATNQREMYYALRRLGKEVVWVHYMEAGHGAGRAGTVSDFHDHWDRILGWYEEHFEDGGGEGEAEDVAGG